MGRNCSTHSVCGSAVIAGSTIALKHVTETCHYWERRGDELHAYLYVDGNPTCKVGFVAKQHIEDDNAN